MARRVRHPDGFNGGREACAESRSVGGVPTEDAPPARAGIRNMQVMARPRIRRRRHDSTSTSRSTAELRRAAAWMEYLAATRDAPEGSYADAEDQAWQQLQRRLQRNDARAQTMSQTS
jgi:hypothetical protein